MTAAVVVFPHQLFIDSPLLQQGMPVWLVEEPLFFRHYRFHRQKLVFHRATMAHYRQLLEARGLQVHALACSDPAADARHLPQHLHRLGIRTVHCHDPDDDWLRRRLTAACLAAGVGLQLPPSSLFLDDAATLAAEFPPQRKRFLMQSFYQRQRLRHAVLMEADGLPTGGRWSFDADNRLRYPSRQSPPRWRQPPVTDALVAARHSVEREFPANPGAMTGMLSYPVTHAQAQDWLQDFLEWRFDGFGPYEDAIVADAHVLHHSVLTPLLNVGLLTPRQVLDAVLRHARSAGISVNSVEGFVRQVLGWREFVRGIYHYRGRSQRMANHFGFTRPMPLALYEGRTGLLPVDRTIAKVLDTGYCHHIERLMVLGNFMLLCEIHPSAVYQWFMELFIDAYDWVMVPNVYGMSQFADGGLLATKPYLSGSNYLRRMSDYPPGEWCELWDALFWRFLARHRPVFAANPRLALLLGTLDRMPPERREAMLARAENYLATLHAGDATGGRQTT